MKKLIKKPIFMFILGLITSASIAVIANSVSANDIVYNQTSTVAEALNNLYDRTEFGNALSTEIMAGKQALVNGTKVTGTLVCDENSPKQIKVGTFTTKTAGTTIDCGFQPTHIMVMTNPTATTYYNDAVYWSSNNNGRAFGRENTVSSVLLTVTSTGFTFTPYSSSYANKTAYYIAYAE